MTALPVASVAIATLPSLNLSAQLIDHDDEMRRCVKSVIMGGEDKSVELSTVHIHMRDIKILSTYQAGILRPCLCHVGAPA